MPDPTLTPTILKALFAKCDADTWAPALFDALEEFAITTPARMSAFLGNLGVESNGLTVFTENLLYSVPRLMAVWPQRFPNEQIAAAYAYKPETLANHIYSGRLGNGDEASGDGWRFRGRGPIQITGRANYAACGAALLLPLVGNPEALLEPATGARSAGWYWDSRNLNTKADAGDLEGITKAINGSLASHPVRAALIAKAAGLLG